MCSTEVARKAKRRKRRCDSRIKQKRYTNAGDITPGTNLNHLNSNTFNKGERNGITGKTGPALSKF